MSKSWKKNKAEKVREWRKNNPEKMKEYNRRYREKHREWRKNNPEKIKEWKKNNPEKVKEYARRYREKLSAEKREYHRQYNIKYRRDNRERLLELKRQWKKNNPEKAKEYDRRNRKKYLIERREYRRTDLKYNLNSRISRAILKSLKGNKEGRHWEDLVGYKLKDLTKRLKRTMPKGYTWKDFLEGKLHIDHIIPISVFNFDKPEHTDFNKCWALRNLRLLTAKENLKKYNRVDKAFQLSLKI